MGSHPIIGRSPKFRLRQLGRALTSKFRRLDNQTGVNQNGSRRFNYEEILPKNADPSGRSQMNAIAWMAATALLFVPVVANADFPLLTASVVIPGCKVARAMDGSDESDAAATRVFAANPTLAMDAAYCAAWAAEAFDRYADQPACFSNDMSIDDLILVVIDYAKRHPESSWMPFLSLAGGALLDRWPDCVKRATQ